jgi:hypothetical protein
MNRKIFIVVLIVQFILMGLFLIYGLVQRTQAIKNEELARLAQVEAENQAKLARATSEAFKEELERCRTRK